jgi:hypothetical protein
MSDPEDLRTETAALTSTQGVPDSGDDFFCLRYRVWYPSFDCAIRTRFQTSPGCSHCDQGRFNLKRHDIAIRSVRWRLVVGD